MPLRDSLSARIDRWIHRSVRPDGECWIWWGTKTRNGYGQVMFRGTHWMAHRAFYEYFVAQVPERLDLDHLCRNRACVNPWHLEPVTRSVNLYRATTVGKYNTLKTHCPHGHPYSPENTAVRRGKRVCRTCERDRATRIREAAHGSH